MKCAACSFESPEGFKFCGGCGATLSAACPGCSFENPPGIKFCGQCGTKLGGEAAAEPEPAAPRPKPLFSTEDSAVRRQVTVMFCDLADSTFLSENLDPEELHEILGEYQRMAAGHIEAHHGHVAQYLGDGILAYFGWPQVHEDAARHGVAAGLDIVADMRAIAANYSNLAVELSVRVGLHTGLVVVGEVGGGSRTETLALGKTPNVAARLQGLADRNTVVVSETTHDLVRGYFEFESLGKHELKGVARPMEVQQAVAETGAVGRIEDSEDADLIPLAGRERELEVLNEAYQRSQRGESQTVLLWAEAGVGKTRLLAALRAQVEEAGGAWLHCYCSQDYQHSALKPVYHLLRRIFGISRKDEEERAIEKLRAGMADWEPCPDDWYPLFASQLGLPYSGDNLPAAAQQRKERTLEAVVELLQRMSEWKPLVLSVENIHWCDPSTRELLGRIVALSERAKLTTILTFRAILSPPWPESRRVTHLPLEPLSESAVHEMIESVTEGHALPPQVTREIVERTDGVPLFVEELTRMLIRSELLELKDDRYEFAGAVPEQAIPNTLQDLLLTRLERLGPSLELAKRCSVLGRRFSHGLVHAIADMIEETLRDRLSHLVAERVLRQEGSPPEASYTFRHALLHDAAYESLLKKQRRLLHSEAADALRAHFPDLVNAAPEILAQHLEGAERYEEAIGHRVAAGTLSTEGWAHDEAISQFDRAIKNLDALPPSPERDVQRLQLLSSLGVAHISTKGYGAREVKETFDHAATLCEQAEDTPFPIRYGIWAVSVLRSDREALAEQAVAFQREAEQAEDEDERLMATASIGTWAFYRGDLAMAADWLGRTRDAFDPKSHHRCARTHGGCGGFYGHLISPWCLVLSGRVERALSMQAEVVELARTLEHPYTLSMALVHAAVVAHDAREPAIARALAAELAALSADQGFALSGAVADIFLGWTDSLGGDAAASAERVERGLTQFRSTGALTLVPYYSSYLAETLLAADKPARARAILEEAAEMSRTNMDAFHLPEQLRLIGDALAGEGADREQVQQQYRLALETAREAGTPFYEIRSALSLARSLRGSAGSQDAQHVLRRAIEGLESNTRFADLDEARGLLAELDGA